MDRLWMQRFRLNLPQVSAGALSSDRKVFSFLSDSSSGKVRHCGLDVSSGDILVTGFDAYHVRSEADLRLASLSLPADEFPVACKAIVGHEISEAQNRCLVRPSPALMSRLSQLHKAIGQLAHDTPDILELPEVARALEQHTIHLLVRCLAEGVSRKGSKGFYRHDAIIAQFEEFLAAHPDQPLYITEICGALGVSERTLRACCEERLGMGPIRYLTLRRMHLVRRALLRGDPSSETVTTIVTDHGFWELGRFSVAYRSLFGETPSQTLRRPARYSSLPFIEAAEATLIGRSS
ncbi:hypothetical protein LMTR3_26765 [Bradyrhizobium sp. LMTR 3]|nr:hypothetical protein LMTR3_26765 [Bradyrhizobium sp. LMTR 3]